MKTENVQSEAENLLKYFNIICRYQAKNNIKNIKQIELCLKLNGNDESALQEYMQWYCLYKNDQDLKPSFEECIRDYIKSMNILYEFPLLEDGVEITGTNKGHEIEKFDEMEVKGLQHASDNDCDLERNDKDIRETARGKRKSSGKSWEKEVKLNEKKEGVIQTEGVNKEGAAVEKNAKKKPVKKSANSTNSLTNMDPMKEIIQNTVSEFINSQFEQMVTEVKKETLEYIEDMYGEKTQIIKLKFDEEISNPIEDEIVNEKMREILNFVIANEPVYLVGPTGCGKNHVCKQVAKILNLPFYFSNAITQEYKLVGFTDANGMYHETQFYKAFKDGGLFLLDELDASLPDALIILNAAISNGYFDFPAPIGFVEANPNFRVIAAGNTWGNGADIQYVGRNQLDMASLDRFAIVRMDYSRQIEAALCPDSELRTFLREYRRAINKNGIMSAVSYRAFRRMYKLQDRFDDLNELLECCLCKGLCKDDLMMIYDQIRIDSIYRNAIKQVAYKRSE